jgi:small subunit ribosomal protein S16
MAVVIRLKRVGAKKDAAFRIVVADSRRARDGRFIAQLGFYDPQPREAQFKVDIEKAQYWLGVGAQASNQVRSLLKKAGVAMASAVKKAKKAEAAPKAKKAKGSAKKTAPAREVARRDRKRAKRAERRTVATKKKTAAAAKPAAAEAVAAS